MLQLCLALAARNILSAWWHLASNGSKVVAKRALLQTSESGVPTRFSMQVNRQDRGESRSEPQADGVCLLCYTRGTVRLCGRARTRVEVGHHGALELAESVCDDRGVAARLGAAEPRLLLLGELVLSDLDSDAKVKYPVKK